MSTNTFEIKKKMRGVIITDEIIRELEDTGRSRILKFKDSKGKQYLAHFELQDCKIKVVPEAKYLKHRCPHCGGRIRITGKGYYCENCFGKSPSCKFHCNGILSHRFIQPHEIEAHLDNHPLILDGCYNSQGRIFSAILIENDLMGFSLTSVVDKCPICGDNVLVSPVAFNCCNHENIGAPYHFSLWRRIKGHEVTLDELHELLTKGYTLNEVVLNDENGTLSKARLCLNRDKNAIVPDYFPKDIYEN